MASSRFQIWNGQMLWNKSIFISDRCKKTWCLVKSNIPVCKHCLTLHRLVACLTKDQAVYTTYLPKTTSTALPITIMTSMINGNIPAKSPATSAHRLIPSFLRTGNWMYASFQIHKMYCIIQFRYSSVMKCVRDYYIVSERSAVNHFYLGHVCLHQDLPSCHQIKSLCPLSIFPTSSWAF